MKTFLAAHAGWVAAIGLLGCAVYELTAGNYPAAGARFLGALAAVGVHLNASSPDAGSAPAGPPASPPPLGVTGTFSAGPIAAPSRRI